MQRTKQNTPRYSIKICMLAGIVGLLLFPIPSRSQFLPPGLPLPDNHGEDVMADHLIVGNTIHLVWASNVDHTGTSGADPDIFYIRHDGLAWSAPVLVNSYGTEDNDEGHDERLPRLACAPDGTLHCVWQSRQPLQGGTDWDVMYSGLTDTQWSKALALTEAPVDQTLPTVIARQDGEPVVVWQDARGGLHYRVRGPAAWSADQRLFTPPVGMAGTDVGPVALARASDGQIVAVWSTTRDLSGTMGTDADIVYSTLLPDASWMSPVPVSDHAYGDEGADINPVVVLLKEGPDLEIHVVWESTSDLVGNGTEGDLLGAVYRFPSVFPSANPTYLVNSNGIGDLHGDHLPSLCAEPGGVVHVAWQTRDAFVGDLDVLHAYNATPGGLWTPFDLLGQNGYFDGPGADDSRPDIECSAAGQLSGVWQSRDNLLGWISGGDHEVFHALGFGLEVSRPEPITPGADFDMADDSDVTLVVDDRGVMHAVFLSNEPSFAGYVRDAGSHHQDVFYMRNEGYGWSDPQWLSDYGEATDDPDNMSPRMAVDQQQRVHVIWMRNIGLPGANSDFDTYVLYYAVRTGQTWSSPEIIATSEKGGYREHRVRDLKLAPDGTPHILWQYKQYEVPFVDRHKFQVYLSWSKRTASGWLPQEQCNAIHNPANTHSLIYGASLLVDRAGTPHVCWSSDTEYLDSGPDNDILYTARKADTWSTPVYVNDAWQKDTADDRPCCLIENSDGRLLVVITSDLDRDGAGAADEDLFVSFRSETGWQPMTLLLDAARTDDKDENTVVADIQGNLLVVAWSVYWEAPLPTGGSSATDRDCLFAVVDLSGGLPSPALPRWVNATAAADDALGQTANYDSMDSLCFASDAYVHFAWTSNIDRLGTGQTDWDIYHASTHVPIPLLDTSDSERRDIRRPRLSGSNTLEK